MIEENSDDDFGTDEGVEQASDSVPETDQEGSSDSLLPFPEGASGTDPEEEEEDISPTEKRREKRRRQRIMEGLAESFGLEGDEAMETLALIDDLLPDPMRMSTAGHVGQRLEHAMKDLRSRHPKLMFNRVGKGLDVTDPSRYFYPTGAFSKLLDDEEGLLRAIVINDRVRAGAERMVMEHEAVRSLLLAEYVRRSTLVEQWRHLLPKYMLPIFSMLEAAGAKADDVRVDMALFNRIRDVIVEWSGGMVSRADIMMAARRTEEEFLHALKDDVLSETVEPVEESFDACRERLRFALAEARSDLEDLDGMDADEFDLSEASRRIDRLMTAISIDAGMDATGRLVFPSVDTFMDAIAARRRARRGLDDGADEGGDVTGEDAVTGGAQEPDDLPEVGSDDDGAGDEVVPVREPVVEEGSDESADESRDPTGDVDTQAEVMDGPSAEDYGPDIPDDLFGPGGLDEDDDDSGEEGVSGPSDDDHPFADDGTGEGPEAGVSQDGWDDDELAPIGEGPLAFDPSDLGNWPSDNMAVRRIAPGLARSTGLSRSTFGKPFTMWRPSMDPPPFSFMGFRLQPDLSARQGQEGPIEPVDLSRLEIGDGQWKAASLVGPSRVLGQSHPLMLPPHSRLSWYGRTLGWGETDIRGLGAFGSPAKPETVTPKGDGRMLADAMRGVARLRLAELVQRVPGHFLSDAKAGAERRAEAAEDLARYWIFVLLARHDQAGFDLMFGDGFFQGIHGPDFVVDASGEADFGGPDRSGHIGIFSPELVRKLPPVNPQEPFVGTIGDGVMSGIRRPLV